MDAVIKIGGSLAEQPEALRTLCLELSKQALRHSLVVVPGGGAFADAVRSFDRTFNLPALAAHRMAILAMDEYGLALAQMIPNSAACDALANAQEVAESHRVAVFLPSNFMFSSDPFEASWDITSDSIAAYVASELSADKLVLVTDVDGVFDRDPKSNSDTELLREASADWLAQRGERTSVDKCLPLFLLEKPLNCYVVNGLYPERVNKVLAGRQTICTKITTNP